jgi:hypothetical protein
MWPEDRSWCLSTEVDSPSTCLGGSSDLIADVLTTAELDGVSVDLDERLG